MASFLLCFLCFSQHKSTNHCDASSLTNYRQQRMVNQIFRPPVTDTDEKMNEQQSLSSSSSSSSRGISSCLQQKLHQFFEFIRPSNALNVFLSGFGGFLVFSIVMFTNIPSTLDDNTQLLNSIIHGRLSQASMIVNLTLLILLYVDQLLDGLQNVLIMMKSPKKTLSNGNVGKKAWKTVLNAPERMVFMFGMAVVPIVSLLSPSTPKLALLWHCSNRAQVVFVGGIIFASKCRHDVNFAHPLVQWLLYIFFIFGNTLSPFSANDLSNETYDTWQAIGCYTGAGICMVTMFRCLVQLSYKLYMIYVPMLFEKTDGTDQKYIIDRINANNNDDDGDGDIENDGGDIRDTENTVIKSPTNISNEDISERNFMVYQFIYVACIIIWGILKLWVDLSTPNAIYMIDYHLFLLNIPDIIFLFMLMVFTMRLVKYEVIETMEALDAEKQYIRCISHEIRVPQSYESESSNEPSIKNPPRSLRSALSVSFHENSIQYEYTDDQNDVDATGEGKTGESREKPRTYRSVGSSRAGRTSSRHGTIRSEVSSITSPASLRDYEQSDDADDVDLRQAKFLRLLKTTSKDASRNAGENKPIKARVLANLREEDEDEDKLEARDDEKTIISVDKSKVEGSTKSMSSEPVLSIADHLSETTSQSEGKAENKIAHHDDADISPVINTEDQLSTEEQRPSQVEEWEKEKNKVMGSFMRIMMARNNM